MNIFEKINELADKEIAIDFSTFYFIDDNLNKISAYKINIWKGYNCNKLIKEFNTSSLENGLTKAIKEQCKKLNIDDEFEVDKKLFIEIDHLLKNKISIDYEIRDQISEGNYQRYPNHKKPKLKTYTVSICERESYSGIVLYDESVDDLEEGLKTCIKKAYNLLEKKTNG